MLPALRSLQPSRNFIIQVTSAGKSSFQRANSILFSGALAITGDVVCQLAIEKAEKLDVRRSLRFGILIGCVIAPIQYRWFKFLESRVQSKTVLGTGVKRMVCYIVFHSINLVALSYSTKSLRRLFLLLDAYLLLTY
jgi:hypothetical protein